MKQWLKRSVIVMVIACIFLGSFQNVRAEETLISSEVAEKYFGNSSYKYYDVGSSIAGDTLELRSDSSSLKVGDMVEVQIVFNAQKAGFDLKTGCIYLYFDTEVLQYKDLVMRDKFINNANEYKESDGGRVYLYFDTNKFDQEGCIATVKFQVKKEASSVTVYCDEVDLAGDANDDRGIGEYFYLDDTVEGGGYKVMSLTVTDTASLTPTPDPVPAGTLEFGDGTVEGNGDITVPISIKSNDGFAALGLTVTYDAALFDYTGLEVDGSLESDVAVKSIDLVSDGEIRAAFVAGRDITNTGNFLNLKLKVKDGVAAEI